VQPTLREQGIPSNLEAEEAVLGSVLLDREVIGRLSSSLAARDFYREQNSTIYQAMLNLYERDQPVDYLTLIDELERTNRGIDLSYLTGLLGVVPTPIHAESYARLVATAAFMRRLISAGGQIASLGFQSQYSPETALERCEAILAAVAGSARAADFVGIVPGLQAYLEQLSIAYERDPNQPLESGRLPTTYRDLDRYLRGGFSRGDLVILAGRPAMGKTALSMEIVGRAASIFKLKVAVFSLEMSVPQLLARMVSTTSGIPLATLDDARSLSSTQQDLLGRAFGQLAETNIVLDSAGSQTINAIRSKVRRQAARYGLDLVVIDHIQMVHAPGQERNRVAELGEISRGLKALAMEQNLAIVALSQLSRAVENRQDKRPILSDLRESGTLEQDADVVLGLYRDEYYNKDTDLNRVANLLVLKNRNGATGDCNLIWNPETTGFRGLEDFLER
jgi:replicative DNA helicase